MFVGRGWLSVVGACRSALPLHLVLSDQTWVLMVRVPIEDLQLLRTWWIRLMGLNLLLMHEEQLSIMIVEVVLWHHVLRTIAHLLSLLVVVFLDQCAWNVLSPKFLGSIQSWWTLAFSNFVLVQSQVFVALLRSFGVLKGLRKIAGLLLSWCSVGHEDASVTLHGAHVALKRLLELTHQMWLFLGSLSLIVRKNYGELGSVLGHSGQVTISVLDKHRIVDICCLSHDKRRQRVAIGFTPDLLENLGWNAAN